MRITFDVTTCAKPQLGGIATYGWELVTACARVAPATEITLAVRTQSWRSRQHLDGLLAAVNAATGRAPGSRKVRLLFDALPGAGLSKIDVLHSIGVRLPPRGRGRFARVVTVHDLNVFEFPELSDADWREERRARIEQTLARADRVIVYSHAGAEAIAQHLLFPPEHVRVVPIGVDPRRFRPLPPDETRAVLERFGLTGRPYVLNVGAFSVRKNQTGLLAAFARAKLPDDWLLVLGGPAGEKAEALRVQARALGLAEERLRLPGWIEETDYPALLCGAAFAVCASLHEGFGIPVIQAQACGTPVLSSDRGGLPETVGDCGVLVDPGDEPAFAAALARIASDTPLRARLSAAGPERVARHFTWEQVARATLAVHAEVSGTREAQAV